MGIGFASIMGRLLIIPVALSGMCLSMIFGAPMAEAATTNQPTIHASLSNEHGMILVQSQEQEPHAACCATVQMEHNSETTTPTLKQTPVLFFATDIPPETRAREPNNTEPTGIPPSSLSLHQPFSLIGIIGKRE